MNATLFVTIFLIEATLSGFLTEAIKKWYENANKTYSSNVIALVDSIVLGAVVTACYYIVRGIPFNINNIICIVALCCLNWFGSMLGYDKIIQLLKQLGSATNDTEGSDKNDTRAVSK